MKQYLQHLGEHLRSSFWLVPTVMAVAAIALSQGMQLADQVAGPTGLPGISWMRLQDSDSARSLLAMIAGSTITVAGTVFSITTVAAAANHGLAVHTAVLLALASMRFSMKSANTPPKQCSHAPLAECTARPRGCLHPLGRQARAAKVYRPPGGRPRKIYRRPVRAQNNSKKFPEFASESISSKHHWIWFFHPHETI